MFPSRASDFPNISIWMFPAANPLSRCEGGKVADRPCGPLRSATQTGSDSISYQWKECKWRFVFLWFRSRVKSKLSPNCILKTIFLSLFRAKNGKNVINYEKNLKKSEFYRKIRKCVAVMTAIILKISKSHKSGLRQLSQSLQSTRLSLIVQFSTSIASSSLQSSAPVLLTRRKRGAARPASHFVLEPLLMR